MARRNTSAIEDLISVASRLPWWIGGLLAVVSYVVLHMIASRPVVTVAGSGQMADAAMKGLFRALAMFGQYVFPFAFGLAAIVSGVNQVRRNRAYTNLQAHTTIATVNDMGWQDFERLVEEHYRRRGFSVTRRGGDGPDGGIDLEARKKGETYLVQCKHWRAHRVGVEAVREFYGVMASRGAVGGYFIVSGEYTEQARSFAAGHNLQLVNGEQLLGMISPSDRNRAISSVSWTPDTPASDLKCPLCESPMVKRVARKGRGAGKEFWGCIRFPKCNGTRPFADMR